MYNTMNGVAHMKLTDQVVQSFHVVRDEKNKVNSIDFTEDGKQLVSCDRDDKIGVYDCDEGKLLCTIHTKKYGAGLIRKTPIENCVIHSSTKVDDAIRYLNLDRKEYSRYFPGHTKKVISLCVSPKGKTFLSGSMDGTLRLWDYKSSECQAVLNTSGQPIVASFDPEGVIFAAGINSEAIKLYDVRSFEKGPFETFKVNRERECEWSGIKFSEDRQTILISTNRTVLLIDAFTGNILNTFTEPSNRAKIPLEASYSPCSQFIFVGGFDGRIHVWNKHTGYKVCALEGNHQSPAQCVQVNPKFMMLASAGANLTFWLPNPEKLQQ